MSDYINRDETISTIWNAFNSYGNSAMHFEVEETKAIRKFCSRLQREIELLPTLDEKEIIRKPFERVVTRLEESKDAKCFLASMPEQRLRGSDDAYDDAIEIVKEEGGIE